MSAERYKISECELDVLAITGPEGTYYIDGENIEARAIRQQSADIAELRAELAAAIAERDGLGYYRAEFEPIWDGLQDALEGERHIDSYGLGESEVECVRRVLRERDILRARLAEYADAPTVGYAAFSNGRAYGLYFDKLSSISAEYSQVDLIVRPEAK